MAEEAKLNEDEQQVMDHIMAAMNGIQNWRLLYNGEELTAAVHVLQGFVIAHMLQRIAPTHWSSWYEK